jgi:hypothetical protein
MFASSSMNNKAVALHQKISFGECSGLNIDGDAEVKGILGLGGRIQSNSGDPELILFIKFKEPVNISGIQVECFDKEYAPTSIQLFSNLTNLDFGDIGNIPSTETLNLGNNLGKQLPLKVAKFRSVSNIIVIML